MYHSAYPRAMPHAASGMPAAGSAPMMNMPAMNMPVMPVVPGNMPAVVPPNVPSGLPMTSTGAVFVSGQEQSYVENILRMNLGKVATIYMTFENNSEWNAKVFKGVLEAAGRDHIIISDPSTGRRYLLLTVNLDYITFDEPLNYTLPFGAQAPGTAALTR